MLRLEGCLPPYQNFWLRAWLQPRPFLPNGRLLAPTHGMGDAPAVRIEQANITK